MININDNCPVKVFISYDDNTYNIKVLIWYDVNAICNVKVLIWYDINDNCYVKVLIIYDYNYL